MSLNPHYMISPNLQEYFVDKSTGLPLSGGTVTYYIDSSRSDLKPVYTLSGTFGSYSFTALPNPLTLSGVGTTQDGSGNDVRVYYYPYDSNLELELYYIVVKDSSGVTQLTRQAWPNLSTSDSQSNIPSVNYIPNGQFLTHTNIPPTVTPPSTVTVIGQVPQTQPITNIAQGGWIFERPAGTSTATDFVTFVPNNPVGVPPPAQAPRFSVNIINTVPGTDAFKYLAIKWPDVNKFSAGASQPLNQGYTFSFTGFASVSTPISILVRQFFGTGGSPSSTNTYTIGSTINLTTQPQVFTITNFNFTTTAGKTIGTNNDDYVQIIFSLPVTSAINVTITDSVLTLGNQPDVVFPPQTDGDILSHSLVTPTPDPNGNDLLLPLVLTRTGLAFDHSVVGEVVASEVLVTSNSSHPPGRLLANGDSFQASTYDPLDGIPYSRLQAKWLNSGASNVTNIPLFGTGLNYVTCYQQLITSVTNSLRLTENKAGTITAPATDGAIPTGFTFKTSVVNTQGTLGFTVYWNPLGLSVASRFVPLSVNSDVIGVVTAPSVSGTGILLDGLILKDNASSYAQYLLGLYGVPTGAGPSNYISVPNASAQTWLIWFKIDGVGAAPVGTTVVEVDILSTYTVAECNAALMAAINGLQGSTILCTATPPAGSYWTFYTPTTAAPASQLYVVWYQINGSGIQPIVPNAQYIKVSLTGSPTTTQIAQATQLAINSEWYALPDLRGVFLRGYDPTVQWDYDQYRGYVNPYTTNPQLGGFELDTFGYHTHGYVAATGSDDKFQAGDTDFISNQQTGGAGADETVPINSAVTLLIKY